MLEEPNLSQEITPKELETFRQEIKNLFEVEKQGNGTSHFTDPNGDNETFQADDLGVTELLIWRGFKLCQLGTKPLAECLQEFHDYRHRIATSESSSLATSGLISYVGNKLAALSGQQQLKERKINGGVS